MNEDLAISVDAPEEISAPSSKADVGGAKPKTKDHGLVVLIGAGKRDFQNTESIDAFIRAERATWSS